MHECNSIFSNMKWAVGFKFSVSVKTSDHDKLMSHYSRLTSKLLIRKQVWSLCEWRNQFKNSVQFVISSSIVYHRIPVSKWIRSKSPEKIFSITLLLWKRILHSFGICPYCFLRQTTDIIPFSLEFILVHNNCNSIVPIWITRQNLATKSSH